MDLTDIPVKYSMILTDIPVIIIDRDAYTLQTKTLNI